MTSIKYPLLLCAALLLIAAGCSRDDDDQAAPDAPSVNFSAISTRTAGADDDAGSFAQYGILHACLNYKENKQTTLLTYNASTGSGTWTADETIYWQSNAATEADQTLALWRGTEGDFTLPADMGGSTTPPDGNTAILNYALHDRLFASYTGPAVTQQWELEHRMAQLCVVLSVAEGTEMPTEEALARATVSMTLPTAGSFSTTTGEVTRTAGTTTTGSVKFYRPAAAGQSVFYAVALPGDTRTRDITITIPAAGNVSEQTYRYTATQDIRLQAGHCHTYALALGVGVKPLNITTTGWTAASGTDIVDGATLTINGVTEGSLGASLAVSSKFYKKIIVNGALNAADYVALKAFVDMAFLPMELEINASGNTTIPKSTFYNGTNLASVVLTGVTGIGEYAFASCRNLTRAVIPASVATWGISAFNGSDLTEVMLTEGLKAIGRDAFSNCKNLKSVVIPASVTSWDHAFTSSGLQSVTLTNGLKGIGEYAFNFCRDLKSIAIPGSVESMGNNAFGSSGLTEVTLAEGLKTIGERAFDGCKDLTGSVTIPSTVTSFGDYAFANSGLTGVELPTGLTIIGNNAFEGCSELTNIEIPASVKTIGCRAFASTGLTSVLILSTGITWNTYKVDDYFGGKNRCFDNCASLQKVAVGELYPNFESNASGNGAQQFFNDDTRQEPKAPVLFLYNTNITTEEQAKSWQAHDFMNWGKVYYNYKGFGDKLDPSSYNNYYDRPQPTGE